jgi:hypothetical protein
MPIGPFKRFRGFDYAESAYLSRVNVRLSSNMTSPENVTASPSEVKNSPGSYQSEHTSQLLSAPERARQDLWWVGDVKEELLTVAADIAWAVVDQARPWFALRTDLDRAFRELEVEHDCFNKYYRAMHFAKRLGDDNKTQFYSDLLEAEAARIGRLPDGSWPEPKRSRKRRPA